MSVGSSSPICNCTDDLLGYSLSCVELPVHALLQLICEGRVTPTWPKCIKLTKHASNNCTAYVLPKVLHLPCMCYTEHTHMVLFRKP